MAPTLGTHSLDTRINSIKSLGNYVPERPLGNFQAVPSQAVLESAAKMLSNAENPLIITGSDVYQTVHDMRSDDGGKTWTGPT